MKKDFFRLGERETNFKREREERGGSFRDRRSRGGDRSEHVFYDKFSRRPRRRD